MSNIIGLVPNTPKPKTANEVFKSAIEGDQYVDAIIIGYNIDDELIVNHTGLTGKDVVFMLEMLKLKILQGGMR